MPQKGEVPADADAVVIAGPAIAFSAIEADALDKYLANNGKLFVLLDPYVTLGLDDLLKKYGMKYEDDLVLYRVATTTGAQMTFPLAAIYQGGFPRIRSPTKFAQANFQLLIRTPARSRFRPRTRGSPIRRPNFFSRPMPMRGAGSARKRRPPVDPEATHLQQDHRHSRAADHCGRVRRRHDDRPEDQGDDVRHAHRRRRRGQIPGK